MDCNEKGWITSACKLLSPISWSDGLFTSSVKCDVRSGSKLVIPRWDNDCSRYHFHLLFKRRVYVDGFGAGSFVCTQVLRGTVYGIRELLFWEAYFPSAHRYQTVNKRHLDQLTGLLRKTDGAVVLGGRSDPVSQKIKITIVKGVKSGGTPMESECLSCWSCRATAFWRF